MEEVLRRKCPCDGCILFVLCKCKEIDEFWFATELSKDCSILAGYLTNGHHSDKFGEYLIKVDKIREVFRVRKQSAM